MLRRPLQELALTPRATPQTARKRRRRPPGGANPAQGPGVALGLGAGLGPLLWRGGSGGGDLEWREEDVPGARGSVYSDADSEVAFEGKGDGNGDGDGPHPETDVDDARSQGDEGDDDTREGSA